MQVLVSFLTIYFISIAVENDLDLEEAINGLHDAQQNLAKRRKQAGKDPNIHKNVMKSVDPAEYFARSKEPRTRSLDVAFRVGEVVRHIVWKYKAVVVGWDPYAKVPESWIKHNSWSSYDSSQDPGALGSDTYWRIVPNYALLVDSRDRPGTATTTYVPQTNLEAVRGIKIMNKHLPDYFTRYMSSCGLYVPLETLALTYPDDLMDCQVDVGEHDMEWVSWTADPTNADILNDLLHKRADISALEDAGSRPVHWAAQMGHVELLSRIMRKNKEDAQTRDSRGMDAAAVAAQAGHMDILAALVTNRVPMDGTSRVDQKPLLVAAAEGHIEITSWLLQIRVDVSSIGASGIQAVHRAVKYGHEKILAMLIDHDVDIQAPDEAGIQPLHIAVERGHDKIVKALVERHADANAMDRSGVRGLFWAAARGYLEIARQLVEARAKVDPNEDSLKSEPLYWASEYGRVDVVHFLIAARASVNAGTTYGSALRSAIQHGHLNVAQSLIGLRAEVTAETELDRSSLATLLARSPSNDEL